jgi:peptidoglycan L-alanyl-D-glutamate endopeptidase CwlK
VSSSGRHISTIAGMTSSDEETTVSRALDDLHPSFRPKAIELLARLTEAGIPVLVVDTLRTPAEHAANLAKGVSWTTRSKHLDGLAIDICPYETYALAGPDKLQWDSGNPIWNRIGLIGEALGLRWGGRWKVRDVGHFELPTSTGGTNV